MYSRHRYNPRKDKGFTLLEVLVAITILLLVILPLASLYVRSLTVIQNAALYSQAIQLGQERVEICNALNYQDLYYHNEIFAPGFPFHESILPPSHRFDGEGNNMNPVFPTAYDNRDNPDTTWEETYFDPTDSDDEGYPVPVYRDYYNNYTGQLLDPNYNGLCDDDLDGDGLFGFIDSDMEDVEIATNGRLIMYSDLDPTIPASSLGDTYIPGDGLYDTVVEGMYVSSMDPMWRQMRVQESPSPILDMGLLLDRDHRAAVSDFRHRETTYKNFVRMTTFIDPTPPLGDPTNVDTWVDGLYQRDRRVNDGYTDEMIGHLLLCLERDIPINSYNNFNVGLADEGLVELDAFGTNYNPPLYGIRIIVTVFYLTGEGEVEVTDTNNDGILEEVPMETYGGARRVRLEHTYYNNLTLNGIVKQYAAPRRFELSGAGGASNPARALTFTDITGAANTLESDPCSLVNDGLPYY